MVAPVNPLASVGRFQNQQLSRFTSPNNTAVPKISPAAARQVSPTDLSGDFGNITDRASRQHSLFLQALQAQQARQQQSQMQGGYSGGSAPLRRTGGAAGGPLVGRYKLVAGADQALAAMNAAFRKQFGYDLKVNSGGRTYAEQAAAYARYKAGKGNLAAPPGHSVHEKGRAVDFGGPIQNARSREHQWLQANAGRWGFKWTGKNFKQFEPWHWEWMG